MVVRTSSMCFESGQAVSVIVGEDDRSTVIATWVVGAGLDHLTLQIDAPAASVHGVRVGTQVYVVRPDGMLDCARISSFKLAATPTVPLELLPSTPPLRDERRFPRTAALGPDTLASFISVNGGTRFGVHVIDISGGGASLLSPNPVSEDDVLELRLPRIDGGASVDVPAQVVWVRSMYQSWLVGVEFVDLPPADIDLIERTIFFLSWQEAR